MTKLPSQAHQLSSEIGESFDLRNFDNTQDLRQRCIEEFKSIGLPAAKSEEYRFTPLTKFIEKNFSATSFSSLSIEKSAPEVTRLENLDADHVVMLNGRFSEELSSISQQEGVTILSLEDAFLQKNALVEKYFDSLRSTHKDPFSILNSALWSGGLFLHVSAQSNISKPIVIYNVYAGLPDKSVLNTRIFGLIESGSSVEVISISNAKHETTLFNNHTEEFIVEKGANLTYHRAQNSKGDLYQVNNTVVQQNTSSKFFSGTFTLNGSIIRNNTTVIIDGENCENHLNGLYLLNGKTHADNHTVVDHKQPNSNSNELYKGVMDDQSKGVFNGKIYVRPYAQKTNAFQSNRNVLLSDTATINTKPQLEIWADDVKCSHGCTSGQLDEEAMFYLRSRGIPADTARAMLLDAFASEVVNSVSNESFRNYLKELVSEKLHKPY